MDRLTVLKLIERPAAALRRIGLGAIVDRVRDFVLGRLRSRIVEIDGFQLEGTEVGHFVYLRELREGRELGTVRRLADAIRPGATVLDVGAHLGVTALVAARRVGPEGRVLAFEPNPASRTLLRRNLERNGLADRVDTFATALADHDGVVPFWVSEAGDTSALSRQPGSLSAIDVVAARGDDVLPPGLVVDVVKIDVEGFEPAVLAGLRGTLARASDELTLFVECNPEALASSGSSAQALIELLAELGLELRVIDEANGSLSPVPEPFACEHGYVNLLATRSGARADVAR